MTTEQIEYYRQASNEGTIPDSQNPLFLFQGTHSDILTAILKRDFDVEQLVRHELQQRGLNDQGKWVGFNQKPPIQKRKGPNKRYGRRP